MKYKEEWYELKNWIESGINYYKAYKRVNATDKHTDLRLEEDILILTMVFEKMNSKEI